MIAALTKGIEKGREVALSDPRTLELGKGSDHIYKKALLRSKSHIRHHPIAFIVGWNTSYAISRLFTPKK